MKVLTWNVNRAGASRDGIWALVRREAPDIALMQELSGLPEWVQDRYHCHRVAPGYFSGHRAPFTTAVLSRWPLETTPFLHSPLDWVNAIQRERDGWLLECQTTPGGGQPIRVVSVHSPSFHIPAETLKGVDVSPIKLTNNPELWFTEVLWSLLSNADGDDGALWIVAGDFNSSVLFDVPTDRGNRQVIERMNGLRLTDCLSHFHGEPVPTFRHSGGSVLHQLDYCYVNRPLLNRLAHARVPEREQVFDERLSDHLPIVCEFN